MKTETLDAANAGMNMAGAKSAVSAIVSGLFTTASSLLQGMNLATVIGLAATILTVWMTWYFKNDERKRNARTAQENQERAARTEEADRIEREERQRERDPFHGMPGQQAEGVGMLVLRDLAVGHAGVLFEFALAAWGGGNVRAAPLTVQKEAARSRCCLRLLARRGFSAFARSRSSAGVCFCPKPKGFQGFASARSRSCSSASWLRLSCRAAPSIRKLSSARSPSVRILASCTLTPYLAKTAEMA